MRKWIGIEENFILKGNISSRVRETRKRRSGEREGQKERGDRRGERKRREGRGMEGRRGERRKGGR